MRIRKILSGLAIVGVLAAAIFGGNIAIPLSASVYAQEGGQTNNVTTRGIEISPASLKLNLDPGESYQGKFTVTNRGATEYVFKIYASPYQVSGENYAPTFEGAESAPRAQIARWITFEQDSYNLQVNESVEVKFTITIPSDAVGGGQYAAIFASADPDAQSDSPVNSIGRVGMLLYANVKGDIVEQGEVVNWTISPLIFDKNISASASVKNTGNSDFIARQTLVVKSFFGGKQVFSQTKAAEILPETTRLVNMEWDGSPALGLFRVTEIIDAQFIDKPDENLGQRTTTVLVIPLFLFIIIMIIFIILIMMIVLKIMQVISRRRAS